MTVQTDLLQLRELVVDRKRRRALHGVSAAVARGEIAIVVGAHHCGKTTLLEAAIDAVPRRSGDVLVGGRALRGFARLSALICYQAADAEPALEVRVRTLLAQGQQAESADSALAAEYERRLGLAALRDRTLRSLPRAQRQRALLFASLISRKPYWLLDDPLGGFDPQERSELAPLLLDGARRGAGLLLTASELLGAEALAQHLVLLSDGRVVAHGSPELLRAQAGLHEDATLDQVCVSLVRAAPNPDRSAPDAARGRAERPA